MGNIQWGPCGGKKRRKSSSQRKGVAAAASGGQPISESEIQEAAASSGYGAYAGGYGLGSLGYGLDCPEGIDEDLALLVTAASIAASLWVLYRQIVIQTVGRRKRRDVKDGTQLTSMIRFQNVQSKFQNMKSILNDTSIGKYQGLGYIEGSPFWTYIISGTLTYDNEPKSCTCTSWWRKGTVQTPYD